MGALAMADEKKAAKPPTTTLRVYDRDGEELADLARLRGVTVAELYRDVLAPLVRQALKRDMQERIKKLSD